MKWLALLVGVLCSVGVKAMDVNSADALRNALQGKATVSGNTVTLNDNVELKETIIITGGDIILNLGGKSICNGYEKNWLGLKTYYDINIFNIKGSSLIIQGNGSIYNQNTSDPTILVDGGTLKIQSGYIYSTDDPTTSRTMNAIKVQSGVFELIGGKIEAIKPRYGAVGVYVTNGVFRMYGGEIIATAKKDISNLQDGYGLKIEGGTLQLQKGTITGTNTNDSKYGKAISSNQPLSNICVFGYGVYKDDVLQNMSSTEVSQGTVEIKPIIYKISYEDIENASVSGNRPTSYNVESNPITISATATKDYHDFQGWRLDNTVGKTVTIPTGSTGDKTLVAVWKGKEYKINYNLNGGTNSSENKFTYTYSTENVTSIYDPSRSYYTFENWYKDQSLSTLYGKEIPKGQFGDLDIYAKWNAETYPVKFYDGNTELGYTMSRTVEKGISVNDMPKPSKDGYVFLHWKNGNQPITSVEPGHEPLSLQAVWKEVSFVVKYVSNGGTTFEDEKYTKTTIQDCIWKTEEHIKRKGYVFKGWFLNADFSELSQLTAFPLDVAKGSISADQTVVTFTIYAKWELKDYKIVFENCEGVDNKEYNIEKGVSKDDMPVPHVRDGYKFVGWYKGDEMVEFIEKGTEDITLRAKWEPIEYTITYETNGGAISGEISKYTIEQTVKLVTPTKANYSFAGWYTDSQFNNRFEGDELVQAWGNKTFYAKWSPKTYTLTFDVNGGTSIPEQSYVYGVEAEFARKTRKAGYTFAGWYSDKDLTKPFGNKISATVSGDLILYAKWAPTEYAISYDTYYGKIVSGEIKTYTTEQEVVLPTSVSREGFSFAGWYADDLLKEKITKIEKGSYGDKTVYATWDRGYQVIVSQPSNGKIAVTHNGNAVASGAMVGKGESLVVTATPTISDYVLKQLTVNGTTYTTSPQTVVMPEKDLKITAEFTMSSVPSASAPKIILSPAGMDKFPKGENVKVQLEKTDEATTLYYRLDGSPEKAYSGEFLVESAKDTVLLEAIAKKDGYRDGVTTRYIIFDNGKITLTFDLPLGVKATNPTGGDVVTATTSGGSFEFILTVDKAYYTNLDSMVVSANDSTITRNASGLYTLTNCSSDITVTVSGLKAKTCTVTLQQTENGQIKFTDGADETTSEVGYGSSVSITAVADEDFKFLQWNTGSQSNPLNLTVSRDTTISARFISDYKSYMMTLPQMEGVTVKPFSGYSTEVKKDGTFKFYLVLAKGYREGNLVVRANGEELTKNKGGYAIYHINKNISISVDGIVRDSIKLTLPDHVTAKVVETMSDVAGQGLFEETMLLLQAKAPEGKIFSKWTDGKTDNPRMATAVDAAQLIPLFTDKEDAAYAKVILNQSPGAGITGANSNMDAVKSGDVVQLKVVLLPAYSQSEVVLTADDKVLTPETSLRAASETKTYVYNLPVDKDGITVKVSGLKLNSYEVTVRQTNGGTVSAVPAGKVTHGDKVQLKAEAASGMLFVKWWDGNTLNPYPYTVTSDTEVKACFVGTESTVDNELVDTERVRMKVSGSTLFIEVPETSLLYIWDYKGSLFRTLTVPAGMYTSSLPSGAYLVKVGDGQPVKVVVR